MSKKVNFNKEGDTNVMQIIDFSPLETADHGDDKRQWNAMLPYGDNDEAESKYDSNNNSSNINQEKVQKILDMAKSGRIGQRAIEVLAA